MNSRFITQRITGVGVNSKLPWRHSTSPHLLFELKKMNETILRLLNWLLSLNSVQICMEKCSEFPLFDHVAPFLAQCTFSHPYCPLFSRTKQKLPKNYDTNVSSYPCGGRGRFSGCLTASNAVELFAFITWREQEARRREARSEMWGGWSAKRGKSAAANASDLAEM